MWAAAWYAWFRDDPAQHSWVNAAELERITADRLAEAGHATGWGYWRQLVRHRNVIALCVMYFPNSFVFYFCITWLPTYLKERHGFDAATLGLLSGLPLLLSVVSAAMNTSGQIGSLLCPLIVAYSVEWFKSWSLPLYLMGFLFLLGAVCWLIVDPLKPVFASVGNSAEPQYLS